MITNLEAANARRTEAEAAMLEKNYAEAARCYTWAAEQFEKVWWEMHRTTKSPDAYNMRQEASRAIRLRDAIESGATRIQLEGRIGGWIGNQDRD